MPAQTKPGSKFVATPCLTNFVNWVALEWDGEDYILTYEFPGEPHSVKILDTPKAAAHEAVRREAAAYLIDQCPLPPEWRSPAARVELAHRWGRNDLLSVSNTSSRE